MKITTETNERIETGELQVDDDWPGLFIRGDDCLTLQKILNDTYGYQLNITRRDLIFTLLGAIKEVLKKPTLSQG